MENGDGSIAYLKVKMPWICQDCGHKISSDKNMIMLKDDVWLSIADKEDVLCDKCIEKRLGRKLRYSDLPNEDIWCNIWYVQYNGFLVAENTSIVEKILIEAL